MDNTERKVILKDVFEDTNTLCTTVIYIATKLYDSKADEELNKLLADLNILCKEYGKKARSRKYR